MSDFIGNGDIATDILPSLGIVASAFEAALQPLTSLRASDGERRLRLRWYHEFNTAVKEEKQLVMQEEIVSTLRDMSTCKIGGIYSYSCESLAAERSDFYSSYGSIFFLGIMLSIVFIFAAVLIIYYKQISEGYEDRSRLEIMQNVGMTKKDIRKSINSQMLTIFFLPLATAVLHLAFAIPMIRRLLMIFNQTNLQLLIMTAGSCILVFAIFYAIVYRVTANVYYAIVSGAKES